MATTEEMTIATVEKMATRISIALRGGGHADLADAVDSAAARIAAERDPEFWAGHRPRTNTAHSHAALAEVLLIERLKADGIGDEACDPVRDLMDA